MKKLFLSLSVLLIISSLAFPQDYWQHIHTNDTNKIWTIKIAKNGTIYYGSSDGLFISQNGGQTWDFKYLSNNHYIYDLEFDLDSNLICIAAHKVYKYKVFEDGWEFLFQPEDNTHNFQALYLDSIQIFAGNINGNLYRYDGVEWKELLNHTVVGVTDIIKNSDDLLFTCGTGIVSNDGSVSVSDDNGDTWSLMGLESSYLQDLCIDSQNRLYTASVGHSTSGKGGLYRYNSDEGIWDTLKNDTRVSSVLINKEDSIYVGNYSDGGSPAGAEMSIDMGETWCDISTGFQGTGFPNVMELAIGPDNNLYAIVQDVNSIYKSYSSTIVSGQELSVPSASDINIIPNPFKNQLIMQGHIFSKAKKVKVILYSIKGEQILSKKVKINQGNIIKVHLPNHIPSGTYIAKIYTDSYEITKKIIKY